MLSLLLSFSAAAENLESDPVAELSVASINIWGLSWPIAKQRGQIDGSVCQHVWPKGVVGAA